MLTDKESGKKSNAIVVNILSCIGNPNLSVEFSQNLNSTNIIEAGIVPFAKWFSALLSLPFEDYELKLLKVFNNLLGYLQICESLM